MVRRKRGKEGWGGVAGRQEGRKAGREARKKAGKQL